MEREDIHYVHYTCIKVHLHVNRAADIHVVGTHVHYVYVHVHVQQCVYTCKCMYMYLRLNSVYSIFLLGCAVYCMLYIPVLKAGHPGVLVICVHVCTVRVWCITCRSGFPFFSSFISNRITYM